MMMMMVMVMTLTTRTFQSTNQWTMNRQKKKETMTFSAFFPSPSISMPAKRTHTGCKGQAGFIHIILYFFFLLPSISMPADRTHRVCKGQTWFIHKNFMIFFFRCHLYLRLPSVYTGCAVVSRGLCTYLLCIFLFFSIAFCIYACRAYTQSVQRSDGVLLLKTHFDKRFFFTTANANAQSVWLDRFYYCKSTVVGGKSHFCFFSPILYFILFYLISFYLFSLLETASRVAIGFLFLFFLVNFYFHFFYFSHQLLFFIFSYQRQPP